MLGTGGVYSTAEDLCLFAQVYMYDPGSEAAAELLSEESRIASMQKEYLRGIWPEQEETLFAYGLGWDFVAASAFSKYGVQALLAEGMIPGIIPPQEITPPTASEMPFELTEYAGICANNSMVGRIAISPGGELTLTPLAWLPEMGADRPSETYLYTSDGEFVSEQSDKRLTFVEESNGKTYTHLVRTYTLPGLGQVVLTGYDMERIEPRPVHDAAQQAWNQRLGTKYYVVNEPPISQLYGTAEYHSFTIMSAEVVPGYVGRHRIVDANTAVQDVQIPVKSGRDGVDLEISVIDGKEYLSAADFVYLSERDMEELQAGENVTYAIEANGYARWFTIGEQSAGKTLTVTLPEGGAFAVYDETSCVYYSTVKGNQPVQLPESGKVVLVGDTPGDEFVVTVK